MNNTEHLQKEKNRIKNTDRIVRELAKNNTVSTKTITDSNHRVHRSNATRLFKNLVRLGILKEESRGKYTLSDYMLTNLQGKDLNLLEIYKQVKDILKYHYSGSNNQDKMPPKTQLTREDIKYLMALDGLLTFVDVIKSKTSKKSDEIIKDIRTQLTEKYGNKYIDRTIDVIKEVLQTHEKSKTEEVVKKMEKNKIRDVNLMSFMTDNKIRYLNLMSFMTALEQSDTPIVKHQYRLSICDYIEESLKDTK